MNYLDYLASVYWNLISNERENFGWKMFVKFCGSDKKITEYIIINMIIAVVNIIFIMM